MRLLKIDTSTRTKDSFSRQMAQTFVDAWKASHPEDEVTSRDLIKNPVPHVIQATIDGMYSPPDKQNSETIQAMKLARELIAEIKACDVLPNERQESLHLHRSGRSLYRRPISIDGLHHNLLEGCHELFRL